MKIILDAGHGLKTAGKRCPDDSMREWQFNSAVAKFVADFLAEYEGIQTKFTHDTTGVRDVPLSERTAAANAWGADLVISIHANANTGTWGSANGIETFVYSNKSTAALAFADAIQPELIARTKRANRGIKLGDFAIIRDTKAPAVLLELGFMDNKEEAALLKTVAYRRICAEAIVAALVKHYKITKRAPVVVAPAKPAKSEAEIAREWVMMEGISDGTNGAANITREQMWIMLHRAFNRD